MIALNRKKTMMMMLVMVARKKSVGEVTTKEMKNINLLFFIIQILTSYLFSWLWFIYVTRVINELLFNIPTSKIHNFFFLCFSLLFSPRSLYVHGVHDGETTPRPLTTILQPLMTTTVVNLPHNSSLCFVVSLAKSKIEIVDISIFSLCYQIFNLNSPKIVITILE